MYIHIYIYTYICIHSQKGAHIYPERDIRIRFFYMCICIMMMIAFITIKSSLVPLIEGLCEHMSRFSPSGFFGPSRCLIPTPGLTSEHLCSVCVCMRIHTLTHTYAPTRVKNREDTDNTTIFPSVKNSPPRQATSALID